VASPFRRFPDVSTSPSRDRLPVIAVAIGITALPMLVPLGSGTAVVDIVLLAAIAVTFVWLGSSDASVHLPYAWPVAFIIVGGAIGTFISPTPLLSSLTLVEDAYLLLWAMVLANAVRTPEALRTIVRTWCFAAPLWAVALILYVAKSGTGVLNTTSGVRASFAFGDDNGLALFFVVTLMLIWASRTPRNPLVRAGAICVLLMAIALTGSLAGILGLLAGVAAVATVSIAVRRDIVAAMSFVLVAMVIFGALWLNADPIAQWAQASRYAVVRNSIGREVASRSGRQLLTDEAAQLYQTRGGLGLGPASTKSWLASDQAPYVKEAHDDWTAALVERGIIGLIGVAFLFSVFAFRAVKIADPRRLSEAFRRVIPAPAALLGAVVTIGVYSVTHEVLHDRTAWAAMGLVAGLFLWGRGEAAERW
jgi:O-antigen ligase